MYASDQKYVTKGWKYVHELEQGVWDFISPPTRGDGTWNIWYDLMYTLQEYKDKFEESGSSHYAKEFVERFEKARFHGMIHEGKALAIKLESCNAETANLKNQIAELNLKLSSMFSECPRCHYTRETSEVTAGGDGT